MEPSDSLRLRLTGLHLRPSFWALMGGSLLLFVVAFWLPAHQAAFLACVIVLFLVGLGLGLRVEERDLEGGRPMTPGRLKVAQRQLEAAKSLPPLDQRGSQAVAQARAAKIQRRDPSQVRRRQRGTPAWLLMLWTLALWVLGTLPALHYLYRNLDPSWYRLNRGLPVGLWMVIALAAASFVLCLWVAGRVDSYLTSLDRD